MSPERGTVLLFSIIFYNHGVLVGSSAAQAVGTVLSPLGSAAAAPPPSSSFSAIVRSDGAALRAEGGAEGGVGHMMRREATPYSRFSSGMLAELPRQAGKIWPFTSSAETADPVADSSSHLDGSGVNTAHNSNLAESDTCPTNRPAYLYVYAVVNETVAIMNTSLAWKLNLARGDVVTLTERFGSSDSKPRVIIQNISRCDVSISGCQPHVPNVADFSKIIVSQQHKAGYDTIQKAQCTIGTHVRCPGSDTMCSGNQCCSGIGASGGKTFPCPSADLTSDQTWDCESSLKIENCVDVSTQLGKEFDIDGRRFVAFVGFRAAIFGAIVMVFFMLLGCGTGSYATHALVSHRHYNHATWRERCSDVFTDHPVCTMVLVVFLILSLVALLAYQGILTVESYIQRVDFGLMNDGLGTLQETFMEEFVRAAGMPGKSPITLNLTNPTDSEMTLSSFAGAFYVDKTRVMDMYLTENMDMGKFEMKSVSLVLTRLSNSGLAATGLGEALGSLFGTATVTKITFTLEGQALEGDFKMHLEVNFPLELDCLKNLDGFDFEKVKYATFFGLRDAHMTDPDTHVIIDYENSDIGGSLFTPIYFLLVLGLIVLLVLALVLGFVAYMLYYHCTTSHKQERSLHNDADQRKNESRWLSGMPGPLPDWLVVSRAYPPGPPGQQHLTQGYPVPSTNSAILSSSGGVATSGSTFPLPAPGGDAAGGPGASLPPPSMISSAAIPIPVPGQLRLPVQRPTQQPTQPPSLASFGGTGLASGQSQQSVPSYGRSPGTSQQPPSQFPAGQPWPTAPSYAGAPAFTGQPPSQFTPSISSSAGIESAGSQTQPSVPPYSGGPGFTDQPPAVPAQQPLPPQLDSGPLSGDGVGLAPGAAIPQSPPQTGTWTPPPQPQTDSSIDPGTN